MSVLDMALKKSVGETPVIHEHFWNAEYPFIAIAPRSTLTGVVAPDRVISMGQIELFDIQTEWKQMTKVQWNR